MRGAEGSLSHACESERRRGPVDSRGYSEASSEVARPALESEPLSRRRSAAFDRNSGISGIFTASAGVTCRGRTLSGVSYFARA